MGFWWEPLQVPAQVSIKQMWLARTRPNVVQHLYMWFQQVAKNDRNLTFFYLHIFVYNQFLLNLPPMDDHHFGCIT
jgi:hypothetical protein